LSTEAVRRGSATCLYVQVRFCVEILDGPSALADQCESVLSVSSVVRFSGSTPNTKISPAYSRADEYARSLDGCRDDEFVFDWETQKAPPFLMEPFRFNAATTYSPTHFRVQYNRPCGA
jgi:hypothetical protein